MEELHKYKYELVIEAFEKPSVDTMLDIANIIHSETMCESVEVNELDD